MTQTVLPPAQRKQQRPAKVVDAGARLYRIGAISVIVALIVLWEIASLLSTGEVKPGHPFVPGWEFIATHTLVGLSDYWPGGLGVQAVADGGPHTFIGSVYAMVYQSAQTLWRLF